MIASLLVASSCYMEKVPNYKDFDSFMARPISVQYITASGHEYHWIESTSRASTGSFFIIGSKFTQLK